MTLIVSTISVMLWVAGLVFAAHSASDDRQAAVPCATACLLGCIAYNWAWFPPYPQILLGIEPSLYFCYISVLIGSFCFERAIDRWWGLPLLYLFILDICCHILSAFGALDFSTIAVAINVIGCLQILIFVYIGGGGVRNRLFDTLSYVRHGANSHSTAQG